MTNTDRETAIAKIRENIRRHGHHIYIVSPSRQTPRFAYTIGLRDNLGYELVLAGATIFSAEQTSTIVNEIARKLCGNEMSEKEVTAVGSFGSFDLREAALSWVQLMLKGATDFYGSLNIRAMQIVPDDMHCTFDVPNMGRPWDSSDQPVWQWLQNPWTYPVPESAKAITNLDALRGSPVTEAVRWTDDQWELFAGSGPDVPKGEVRIVPIGTLLSADSSIAPILELKVGKGLWRHDRYDEWHEWG